MRYGTDINVTTVLTADTAAVTSKVRIPDRSGRRVTALVLCGSAGTSPPSHTRPSRSGVAARRLWSTVVGSPDHFRWKAPESKRTRGTPVKSTPP